MSGSDRIKVELINRQGQSEIMIEEFLMMIITIGPIDNKLYYLEAEDGVTDRENRYAYQFESRAHPDITEVVIAKLVDNECAIIIAGSDLPSYLCVARIESISIDGGVQIAGNLPIDSYHLEIMRYKGFIETPVLSN
jgi:hypothetical protein